MELLNLPLRAGQEWSCALQYASEDVGFEKDGTPLAYLKCKSQLE